MEKFEITILGCGSATPSPKHYTSSQVVDVRGKLVEHSHKILAGHIGDGVFHAIATAMQTVQVATQGAFPEKISQRVRLEFVMAVKAVSFEG